MRIGALITFFSFLAISAQAQQVVSLPFRFEVAAGQMVIRSLTGSFQFGTIAPGESATAVSAPSLVLEDSLSLESGYHLTIEAGPFVSASGSEFSAQHLQAAGPVVEIAPIEALGLPPDLQAFPWTGLEQPLRVLVADQLQHPGQGKGQWRVDFLPERFVVRVPTRTTPGHFTSIVTLTLQKGI